MVRNSQFESLDIPDIPAGNLDRITVKVLPDARSAFDKVLDGRADDFDPATPLPGGTMARARTEAKGRFEAVPIPSTLYFYLNTEIPPFSSELARRAVVTALDRPALAQLSKGSVVPDCYLLPPGIAGHPTDDCPYGGGNDDGDLQAGRQLVKESGTGGTPVAVSVVDGWPQRAYTRYYKGLLNRLGFRARLQVLTSSRPATADLKASSRQTGFGNWFNDFPSPADFFAVLDARNIAPNGGPNAGRVDDPFIQQQLEKLSLVPAQDLDATSGAWRDLDEYAARKAYLAIIGTQRVPKLMSDRIDFGSAVIHPLFLSDWSTWALR